MTSRDKTPKALMPSLSDICKEEARAKEAFSREKTARNYKNIKTVEKAKDKWGKQEGVQYRIF